MTRAAATFVSMLVITSLGAAPARAQQTAPGTAVEALDGLDPVLLIQGKEVPGKSVLAVVHGRFNYLFSSADTKATFERDPAKYAIQLGGMCARMGKTAGGNPSDFFVHDGKIYIFGSDECHKAFQAAPLKYLRPAMAVIPTSAQAAARGRDLIDGAVRTIASPERLDRLTTYVETTAQIQPRPGGDVPVAIKTMWRFPDRARQERSMTRAGKTFSGSTILAPDGMWYVTGSGQAYPTPAPARSSLEELFGRHPIALFRARRSAGFKAVATGAATVEGAKVQQVRVVNGAIDVTVNLDASGRLHSMTFTDRNTDGEYGTYTLLYSDFRTVDGLTLPFAVRGLFNGRPDPSQTWTVQSIAANAPLDLAVFAPAPGPGK
jgi:YHS domain-containing protein